VPLPPPSGIACHSWGFAFCSPSDLSRAIAVMLSRPENGGFIRRISASCRRGGRIAVRQGLHAKAPQPDLQRAPSGIAPCKGGVGSIDETISKALIAGRPFVCLSNFRGDWTRPFWRKPFAARGKWNAGRYASPPPSIAPVIWQISTNGAEFTRDLANRSIITRIRKQPPGYRFKEYPKRLIAHVEANQPFYLGCVFAVVREWLQAASPGAMTSGTISGMDSDDGLDCSGSLRLAAMLDGTGGAGSHRQPGSPVAA